MRKAKRGFVRRLPRPVRWLWFAILAVLALEAALVVLGVVLGQEGLWTAALQLASLTAAPVAIGLLVVGVCVSWARRGPSPSEAGDLQPARPASPEVPIEVVAGRRAGEAVASLARTEQGKVAIQRGARLFRAVRAAARPAPEAPGRE